MPFTNDVLNFHEITGVLVRKNKLFRSVFSFIKVDRSGKAEHVGLENLPLRYFRGAQLNSHPVSEAMMVAINAIWIANQSHDRERRI